MYRLDCFYCSEGEYTGTSGNWYIASDDEESYESSDTSDPTSPVSPTTSPAFFPISRDWSNHVTRREVDNEPPVLSLRKETRGKDLEIASNKGLITPVQRNSQIDGCIMSRTSSRPFTLGLRPSIFPRSNSLQPSKRRVSSDDDFYQHCAPAGSGSSSSDSSGSLSPYFSYSRTQNRCSNGEVLERMNSNTDRTTAKANGRRERRSNSESRLRSLRVSSIPRGRSAAENPVNPVNHDYATLEPPAYHDYATLDPEYHDDFFGENCIHNNLCILSVLIK